jgi:aminoglycoside phosphotransferase (APT) family kinase protein
MHLGGVYARRMTDVATAIEAALGSPITSSLPAPWGFKNRTQVVELADGRRVVLQEYSDRDTARVRLRAARQLAAPLKQRGVPIARVLAHDLAAPFPWAAFEELPGEVGYVAAGHDLSGDAFPAIASDMGTMVRRIAQLDPAAFDLPDLWTDVAALSDAAERWLAALDPYLSAADRAATRDVIRAIPPLFGDRSAVVCHGDFGPQNVLVVGDRVTGLLDLEDARIGDPWLDIAWWAWLVRAHTPSAFTRSWRGFLDAAGVDCGEESFDDRVFTLIVLRLLETADGVRRVAPTQHPSWAERLSRTLAWAGAPLE